MARYDVDRKKISLDVDGVLAAGAWTPVEFRTNEHYFKKKPINDEISQSLLYLSLFYDLYILSTRAHPEANLGLRAWIHYVLGLESDTIAGVITHPWSDAEVATDPNGRMDKAAIVRALGIVVHVDDDPGHVVACGGRGILLPSELEGSQEARNRVPTVDDWKALRVFLTTPGMALYGSDGASVVSPAAAIPQVVVPSMMVN